MRDELLGRNARPGVADFDDGAGASARVAIVSQPPFGIASRALRNRLRNTCCSLCSIPCTVTGGRESSLAHLDAAGCELVLEQRQHVVDDGVDVARPAVDPGPDAQD